MTTTFWNHTARPPRHQSEANKHIRTEIVRGDQETQTVLSATLINLSRDGAQLQLEQPLCQGELVVLNIHDQAEGTELSLEATICWLRPEDTRLWSIGCQFEKTIEWESLGELFLNGVLESHLPTTA